MRLAKLSADIRQEIIDYLLAFAVAGPNPERMLDDVEALVDNMSVEELVQVETQMRMNRCIQQQLDEQGD